MAILTRYALLLSILWLAALPARAQDSLQLQEQEIKAGLLYNFLKYTEWPASRVSNANAPMDVCIFGADPFDGYLKPMAGRTVNQRNITLRRIEKLVDAAACHLLFVSATERDRWPDIYAVLKDKSVLTVSDFPGFAASGGMLEFGRRDNHIQVLLNIEALRGGGLRVQDRLIRLVTVLSAQGGGQ